MSLPKIIKLFVQVQICPKLPPHKGYNQKSMGWTSTDTSWTFQVIWFDYFRTLCKRTHGLIICSTWFDFFRQLVFNAFLVFIYTALLVCIYNFNEIVRFDNYINLIKTGVNFELLFL